MNKQKNVEYSQQQAYEELIGTVWAVYLRNGWSLDNYEVESLWTTEKGAEGRVEYLKTRHYKPEMGWDFKLVSMKLHNKGKS